MLEAAAFLELSVPSSLLSDLERILVRLRRLGGRAMRVWNVPACSHSHGDFSNRSDGTEVWDQSPSGFPHPWPKQRSANLPRWRPEKVPACWRLDLCLVPIVHF